MVLRSPLSRGGAAREVVGVTSWYSRHGPYRRPWRRPGSPDVLATVERLTGLDTRCTGAFSGRSNGQCVVQLFRKLPHDRGAVVAVGLGTGPEWLEACQSALVDIDANLERGGEWVVVHSLMWAEKAHDRWRFRQPLTDITGLLRQLYPAGMEGLLYGESPLTKWLP